MPLSNFGIVDFNKDLTAMICRCAQPDQRGWNDLAAMGVKVSLKLNEEYPLDVEQRLFPGEVIMQPFRELFRLDDLDQVVAAARTLALCLQAGRGVVVHCSHGRDRTGLIVGAYRIIHNGWGLKEVNDERATFGCNTVVNWFDAPDILVLAKIHAQYNPAPSPVPAAPAVQGFSPNPEPPPEA